MALIIDRILYLGIAQSREELDELLLACPLDDLLSCEMTIRDRLLNTQFREGIEYPEIELADLRRERGADGDKSMRMEVGAARGRMERIALGLPAARY